MYSRGNICLIFFFVTVIAGAVGDYYCFRDRVPSGSFGRCQNLIPNKNTITDCCHAGGAGWTERSNGRRCGPACSPVTQPPATVVDEVVKYCFRTRVPNGRLGGCSDRIGERTREACCRQGGKGWTDRGSGRRCEDVCLGVDDDGPVQHCFSSRTNRGRCTGSTGEKTRLRCCQDGGIGWSANANGRPCQSACEEEPPEVPAAIHGGWSDWGDWGQCSVTCGEGIQARSRTCDNPAPARGGDDCVGSESESAVCDEGPCPIDGGWGNWSHAGPCSATCYHEGGTVYRQLSRECDNPPPQFGGSPCSGPTIKNDRCTELPHCPVDGGWSEYGDWSTCSQTCDEGIQSRQRTCTNPPPQYNGRQCEGLDTEQKVCRNRRVCPVNGGWSDWGQWSACDSLRCGVDGTKFRSRSCTNPTPRNRGIYCIGPIIDRMACSKCESNQGSGSGDGSGVTVQVFPCDDEDSCNEGAVNGTENEDGSFSYSFDVPSDVPPVDSYEYSQYGDRDGFQYNEEDPDSSIFYSYNENNVDPNEDQPSASQGSVVDNINSDSYSFDDVESNASKGVAEESNDGGSESYSVDY